MRTLSASPTGPQQPDDLDNRVVDGIESLRQRIRQRLRFEIGEWALDTRLGTQSILGHVFTPELATSEIRGAVVDEGGAEIVEVTDVQISVDRAARTASFSLEADTIYGRLSMTGDTV